MVKGGFWQEKSHRKHKDVGGKRRFAPNMLPDVCFQRFSKAGGNRSGGIFSVLSFSARNKDRVIILEFMLLGNLLTDSLTN